MTRTPRPKRTRSKKRETIRVTVLRAIDGYHHRGAELTVPDDDYHRGLVKQGNLRLEKG